MAASPADITALIDWGCRYEHRPDSRLQALIDVPGRHLPTRRKKTWSNERVVIFTEYTSTLEWIVRVLEQKGYGAGAGLDPAAPHRPRTGRPPGRRFSEDPAKEPIRVLVATDSAGEGIDLQAHCHRLVNFDIPFNPSRLEQRIGRIDRYGQTQPPEIFHFVPVASSTTYAADLDVHGPNRREGRHDRRRPGLGEPGHRRRHPAPLRALRRTGAGRRKPRRRRRTWSTRRWRAASS